MTEDRLKPFQIQFVTAIYTGLEGTRLNGNTAAIYDRYKQSLKSLADGGYGILCYTSKSTIEELKFYFKDNENLWFIEHELEEFPLHNLIEDIKDKHPKYTTEDAWRSRCVEIMWGKFAWISPFASHGNPIFWIDAGIFHGGLISNTLRSENSKGFFDFDTITQERDLYEDLCRYAGDKILNIRSTIVNHGSDDYVEVFDGLRPEYGIVGGIFGGKRELLSEYITDFGEMAIHTLTKERLLKEEEIMYYLHKQNPDRFKTFEFDTWYHQDWPIELYNPETQVSFSDFFKVIRA